MMTANVKRRTLFALASNSEKGCGIMTPQPGPATLVKPAIMSSSKAGE
ncbi:MAG: hypothetical protein HKN28_09145 [Alphaproteobacteria bacterium]|nr:hypothetical protein [Alphaproteobacteria bacterium]